MINYESITLQDGLYLIWQIFDLCEYNPKLRSVILQLGSHRAQLTRGSLRHNSNHVRFGYN